MRFGMNVPSEECSWWALLHMDPLTVARPVHCLKLYLATHNTLPVLVLKAKRELPRLPRC